MATPGKKFNGLLFVLCFSTCVALGVVLGNIAIGAGLGMIAGFTLGNIGAVKQGEKDNENQ